MRRLILVGLLAATAAPLMAQVSAPPQPMSHPMGMGTAMGMGNDKTMTRAEVQARVQVKFARRDANRDGFLTTDELAMRGGGGGKHGMMNGHDGMSGEQGMRDPKIAFDRIDTNRDGMISRDEFAMGHQMRIEKRIVVNQPGGQGMAGMEHGGMSGMPGMHGMHHGGGGGGGGMMGAAMLKLADANRDGKVSLAEATAGALRQFDLADANRDGRLSPEERQAGRMRMMQMRQPG